MATTYSSLEVHVVFSTRYRSRWISQDWEGSLYAFIHRCFLEKNARLLEIGGCSDHLHLLIGIKPSHRLSDLIGNIKSASSKWVRNEIGLHYFSWQTGYGAFSVSPNNNHALRNYIRTQKQHHRTTSSLDEFKSVLADVSIEWDPRFLD